MDGALPRYGANIFSKNNETYEPADVGIIPEGYLLGPGDRLYLQVFGKEPGDYEIEVERNGSVIIPRDAVRRAPPLRPFRAAVRTATTKGAGGTVNSAVMVLSTY